MGNFFVAHDDVQIPKSKWGILVTYDGIILTLIFGNYIQNTYLFGILFYSILGIDFQEQGRHKTQFHQFSGKHALADLTAVFSSFSLAYEQGFVRVHDLNCWNNIGNMSIDQSSLFVSLRSHKPWCILLCPRYR